MLGGRLGCGVGRAGAGEGKAERWTGPALAAGPTRKEKEEKELGSGSRAAGERRGLGRAWGLGSWAGLTLGVGLLSISLLLNLIQTKFEFKPQSNKSMHQHECNTKFKPMINFNYS